MVAVLKTQTAQASPTEELLPAEVQQGEIVEPSLLILSLEDWLENPVHGTEWIDGTTIEKEGMTLLHSKVQGRLCRQWSEYKDSSGQGGEVYTEVPCRTTGRGRSPDVAYLTPDLVSQYGHEKVLPQSFPLCAEIVSPTDFAEDILAKAQEYLESQGEEVWLIFPNPKWIIVVTAEARTVFAGGEVAKTQKVLAGFEVAVDELLA